MRQLRLVLILVLATACNLLEPSPVTVPPGAITIPLTVEEGPSAHVTFQPSQIPAGTTFLVIEGPAQGFTLVAGRNSDAAVATPLDSDAVNRVAVGDLEGTTLLPMQSPVPRRNGARPTIGPAAARSSGSSCGRASIRSSPGIPSRASRRR